MRKRKNRINIWLTDRELERLNAMVSRTKLNREQFIRAMLEGFSIREAPPAPLWDTVCLLRQAASAMSIIEKHSLFKQVSDEELLRKTTDEIRLLMRQIKNQCLPIFKEEKENEN